MISNILIKLFPYVFVIFFTYLEAAPIYFFENELVKPLMTFTVIYCWIQHDSQQFRPLWLLFFGLFYDFLKDGIVGLTPLFFLTMYHFKNNNLSFFITPFFNNIWIKFVFILFIYFLFLLLTNLFFENHTYGFSKNLVSLVISVIIFPLFYSMIQRLSLLFGRIND